MKVVPISSSIFNSGDGFDFTASGDNLTINAGVTVLSEAATGVSDNGEANEVVSNSGTIYSADSTDTAGVGVALYNGDASVINNARALIYGGFWGVYLSGNGNESVVNSGTIIGNLFNGVIFDGSPTSALIENFGYIFGVNPAIWFQVNTVPGHIFNDGTISSEAPATLGAIVIDTASTLVTPIDNSSEGVITGINAIYAKIGMFNPCLSG